MKPVRTFASISLLSLVFLTSCLGGGGVTYKEVTVEDQYMVRIPESMEKSNELHDFAQLQYADEKEGYFLIGIDESKQELSQLQLFYQIEDYAHFVTRTVSDGLDTVNVTTQTTQDVNGLSCVSTDLFGAMTSTEEPLEVYYRLMVLESDHHFYQLIAWSGRDQYPRFRSIADEIECSFVELAQADPDGEGQPAGAEPASAGSAAETAE